ncbi:putative ATP-binding cassette transporter [Sporolituus thermophilus DSM 23256]|uniref:Putative ATP-binding cassette transporter n=2 Tax=Sporolituus TaxID=909931 RepID=A0A1G7LU45_9FIRM|nr:putative ATP-binding cassette transporter [Sporolituus thermophilus DSM 23256]
MWKTLGCTNQDFDGERIDGMGKGHSSFCRDIWQLTKEYWWSEEKWQARGLLAVNLALTLGHVYILVLINEWYNTFYNALQNYDKDAFWQALGEFCLLAAIYIIIAVYELYLQQMLEIRWRRWLTYRYLDNWLYKRTYYIMQLLDPGTDNPDQRISEDLRLFTAYTLRLSLGLLKAVVTLVSFVAILWRLSGPLHIPFGAWQLTIPGYLVWAALAYAIIGTWLTVKIGRPLVNLNFDQQRFEADFRFSLVRLREHGESIAFYGGERQEQANFVQRFRHVFANFWQLMQRQKQLTWFTSGYFQLAIIFPILVASPRYFAGQIQLGGLMQISSAFGRVQDSLSWIIDRFSQLAEWQAVVNRLVGFINNMERVRHICLNEAGVRIRPSEGATFTAVGLNVCLPDGRQLIQPLALELRRGDSLLVVGPSGCGKSTLLRTFAGLWPFGQGEIRIPQGQRVLFVPQKSYLPIGTLREALLYPKSPGSVSDAAIREAMDLCRLEGFKDQLDRVEDWSHILSLGEQQRVAFVRVLLQKPDWLFLDEATSALDEPTERALYKLLRERLPQTTIVSVGHRNTLSSHHRKKLAIDDSGNWSILNL